jgi:RNA polymerase sigma-70 factor (ECF subfamily)
MNDSRPSLSTEQLLAHATFVRSLARGLVGDENAAADLEQDAWLIAIERPPRLGSNPRSWLRSVIVNLSRRARRSSVRRLRRHLAVARPEAVVSTADTAERLEVLQSVVSAVAELEEPYRTVVLVRFFDNLSVAEIAARQGVPAATVYTQLARALSRLRNKLAGRLGHRGWLPLIAKLAGDVSPRLATVSGVVAMSVKTKVAIGVLVLLAASASWFAWQGTLSNRSRPVDAATTSDTANAPSSRAVQQMPTAPQRNEIERPAVTARSETSRLPTCAREWSIGRDGRCPVPACCTDSATTTRRFAKERERWRSSRARREATARSSCGISPALPT